MGSMFTYNEMMLKGGAEEKRAAGGNRESWEESWIDESARIRIDDKK